MTMPEFVEAITDQLFMLPVAMGIIVMPVPELIAHVLTVFVFVVPVLVGPVLVIPVLVIPLLLMVVLVILAVPVLAFPIAEVLVVVGFCITVVVVVFDA